MELEGEGSKGRTRKKGKKEKVDRERREKGFTTKEEVGGEREREEGNRENKLDLEGRRWAKCEERKKNKNKLIWIRPDSVVRLF